MALEPGIAGLRQLGLEHGQQARELIGERRHVHLGGLVLLVVAVWGGIKGSGPDLRHL